MSRLSSLKLKISNLILATIAVTVGTTAAAVWLGVRLRFAVPAAVIFGLAMAQLLAKDMTRPLKEMAEASRRLASGQRVEPIEASGSDEVAELASAFNSMSREISRLDSQRRDLVANVSHELRTPLAVLQGRLENILDGVSPADHDSLELMLAQTQRLGDLVSELLDLSRIEAGVAPGQARLVELTEVARDVVAAAAIAPDAPTCQIIGGPVWVAGHERHLHQLIANLVSNAHRHAPDCAAIVIRVERTPSMGRVAVEDTGPGVPEHMRDRVFDRFEHGSHPRGTGLGLSIARWIADLHGGQLRVEDNEPTGSRFIAELPRVTEPAPSHSTT